MTSAAIACSICPRTCRLAPGETGFCHARINNGQAVVPMARCHLSALQIDPVEKKPLFHFFPGSPTLSIGMAGCSLRCKNCQNAEISQHGPEDVPGFCLTPENLTCVMDEKGLNIAAYTYNEPLTAFEYVRDCAACVKENGGFNILVTAAYVQQKALQELLPFIDAANVDLKSMSDTFYKENCDASLAPVLNALRLFANSNVCLEITNLVIPGLNDSEQDFRRLARFVRDELGAEIPLHFSRFFPKYQLKDLPPTPEDTLLLARGTAIGEGLAHVYLGNTNAPETTYCASCGRALITRRGYFVDTNLISGGRPPSYSGTCPFCGKKLYGRF